MTTPAAKRDEPLTQAALQAVIKLTELPRQIATDRSGVRFELECDGLAVSMILKAKQFERIVQAHATGKPWEATIAGRIGSIWSGGFVIYEPAVTQLKFT